MVYYSEGGVPPHPSIFFETSPPIKTDAPHGVPPHLKMMSHSSEKHPPPPLYPLKREAPFHKTIPRKSTINNNLNSS